MNQTVVYAARRILTLDPVRPEATHVAVRDGRILSVGTLDEIRRWGAFELDERFADDVLLPGFVEGHSHQSEGLFWRYVYCGAFDRSDPDGRTWRGLRAVDDVIERLRNADRALADPAAPLFGWGIDPLFLDGARLDRRALDAVSTVRPVGVMHASGHIVTANTAALRAAGFMRTDHDHPGIPLDADRLPEGELRGPGAMPPVLAVLGIARGANGGDAAALDAFARLAVRSGTTTATDLARFIAGDAIDATVDELIRSTGEPDFPLRLVLAMHVRGHAADRAVEHAVAIRARSTERLRMGSLKTHTDGSIQGFTARLAWPGYLNGAPQGLWYVEPEHLRRIYEEALRCGVQVHTHTNGDQAIDLAIDTMQRALSTRPAADHRFALQHCQTVNRAQLRRMKALGLCANFFSNHHFYWGDAHHDTTLGPDRAERMNPCASAREIGVPYTIHSDAPVTPLGPLHVAWCAVNRTTPTGRVLGEFERIGVMEALGAITIGAAYTLHLDHEIGTIECGKRADFAVLRDDPLETPPERLRDVRVRGTVLGGRVFEAT